MQKRITAVEKDIKTFLTSERSKGEEIGAASDVRHGTFRPKFQESDFSYNYPDIYKAFLVESKKWDPRFLNKIKWSEEIALDMGFVEDFSEAESAAQAAIYSG